MGMFDSFYEGTTEAPGIEWQTKAYDCNLDCYFIGTRMPDLDAESTYQVEVLGGRDPKSGQPDVRRSLATVVDGRLAYLDTERANTLPLFDYSGRRVNEGDRLVWADR